MKVNNKLCFVLLVLFTVLFLLTGCSKDEIETTLLTFEDDFSDENSGWDIGESDTKIYSYTDENTYEIQVFYVDSLAQALAPIAKLGPKYNIEADIKLILDEENEGDKGHCGLVFNYYEGGNFYDFYLFRLDAVSGKYKISRYNGNVEEEDEKWVDLTGWKTCSPSDDDFNKLKIVQNNKKASFYLNGQLIEEIDEISIHEEGVSVGVFVSSLNVDKDGELVPLEVPVVAGFDDFEVRGYAVEESE